MNCRIPDNTPRVEPEHREVQCAMCKTKYFVRIFPLHATCPNSELTEFFESHDDGRTGLGDVVEKIIDTVTLGLLPKSDGCGCQERKELLNRWWSWKSAK
jgi:hypothetical protein